MLKTVANFDRIGEENAFAVLARATRWPRKVATSSISASASPISAPPTISSRPPSRRCATAITATPRRPASCRCARRWPPISHQRFMVTVSPDEVMIMPGGKPTMFMSILMFGEPGAEIMYPDPGFPIYRSMIEFTGAKPIPIPDPRGERLRVLGRGNAGADHRRDAADHHQLARQPDRRRHAEGRGRQIRRRPGEVAERRDHVGRDLRSADL